MIKFLCEQKTVNPKLKRPPFSKAKVSRYGRGCVVQRELRDVESFIKGQ